VERAFAATKEGAPEVAEDYRDAVIKMREELFLSGRQK
jgi:hypothetical protein